MSWDDDGYQIDLSLAGVDPREGRSHMNFLLMLKVEKNTNIKKNIQKLAKNIVGKFFKTKHTKKKWKNLNFLLNGQNPLF